MISPLPHSPRLQHGLSARLGLIMLCLATLLVSACSDELDDLRKYTQEVKAKPGGHIAPLPEAKPFVPYLYKTEDKRDPFVAGSKTHELGKGDIGAIAGLQPDTTRRKETLEGYPLDALHMVGSLAKDGKTWAIIKAPDGIVFRVSKNNHLGQNHGRIVNVTENKIDVIEVVPDSLGGWREQPTSLSLEE